MYSQTGGGGFLNPNPTQQQQQQQFGQSGFPGQMNSMQPQPTGFMGYQQTGFPGQQQQPLQSQFTGFPGSQAPPPPQQQPQLQQQFTGFPGQQQQPMQQQFTGFPGTATGGFGAQNLPPIPQIPQQFQQPHQQQQQKVQPTPQPPAQASQASSGQVKIPNVRLSFVTSQDQSRFEQLFKVAVGGDQALSGDRARTILMKSGLSATDLHAIWQLSDTTKSGALLFPEFVLAMYLCNVRKQGKTLPATLPEVIRNEVSGMVDIISFGVPDSAPPAPPKSNVPSFDVTPSRTNSSTPTQSNTSLLASLAPQPAGYNMGGMQSQPTGFQGMQSQPTGFAGGSFQSVVSQPTGFQGGMMPQATGYGQRGGAGNISPVPSMPTGMPTGMSSISSMPSLSAGSSFLQSQATGMPGQWGYVNTPSTGLPGLEALQRQMMPQPGREGGFNMQGLTGNAVIPWAVTKVEKQMYDKIFDGWDGMRKGFIGGDVAIEVFGQSGLPKEDLMRVWTLADPGNKGKLDKDEFAVAMHLIYRKLNGHDIPSRLPPELIPPSTKKFNESVNTVKGFLASSRKQSALQPQATGVSYMKSRSFHDDGNTGLRKDGTVYKFNDEGSGYRSSARHRARGASPSPGVSASSSPGPEEMSLDQLRKRVREKRILLDAIDIKDEARTEDEDVLDRRDRRDADDLYRRIRRVQDDIDNHANAGLRSTDSDAERRQMKRQLQNLTDRLPEIASKVRNTERRIAEAKLELFRLRDARQHPESASSIVGTGPGGAITESDRLKSKSRAMMQQRLAALTGKPVDPVGNDGGEAAAKRLADESQRISSEKANNERMTRDVEESVNEFQRSLEDSLNEVSGRHKVGASEHEKRRWEDGLGVEDEVKDFIFELQRQSRSAALKREDDRDSRRRGDRIELDRRPASTKPQEDRVASPPPRAATAAPTQAGLSSYGSFSSAEDRAAHVKAQAQAKMAERLAALGIKHPMTMNIGETAQQRAEREQKEREERIRKADEEEAQRERARQSRLQEHMPTPPPTAPIKKPSPKAPPPPPQRGNNDSRTKAEADRRRAEEEEQLRREQEQKSTEIHELEIQASNEEEELAREEAAAQARIKAIEEEMRQGKLRKKEEAAKKKAAVQAQKEKKAQLAERRAKIEAARREEERLMELKRQLEEDSSSDDEGPEAIGGQATPTQESMSAVESAPSPSAPSPPPASGMPGMPGAMPQSPPTEVPMASQPPPAPPLPPTSAPTAAPQESKNPFFNKDFGQPMGLAGSETPGGPSGSNNPFFNLAKDQPSAEQKSPTGSALPNVHIFDPKKRDDDDWSVVDDDDDSGSDDDDGMHSRMNTAQLAASLFATMAPRPLANMDKESPPAPSAPPMPTGGAPPPPPPPPPMPGMGGPPPPPPLPPSSLPTMPSGPPPGGPPAFLGQIGQGIKLKKTQTKDKSQPATAGRVL